MTTDGVTPGGSDLVLSGAWRDSLDRGLWHLQLFVALRLVLEASVWGIHLLTGFSWPFPAAMTSIPWDAVITYGLNLLLWGYLLFGLQVALRHASSRVAPRAKWVLWVLTIVIMLSIVWNTSMILVRAFGPPAGFQLISSSLAPVVALAPRSMS